MPLSPGLFAAGSFLAILSSSKNPRLSWISIVPSGDAELLAPFFRIDIPIRISFGRVSFNYEIREILEKKPWGKLFRVFRSSIYPCQQGFWEGIPLRPADYVISADVKNQHSLPGTPAFEFAFHPRPVATRGIRIGARRGGVLPGGVGCPSCQALWPL